MTYNKTNWVDGVTPVSAQNMNNLETQYEKAKADLDTHKADNANQHHIFIRELLRVKMRQTGLNPDPNAWSDTLEDDTGINTGDSSGYTLSDGKLSVAFEDIAVGGAAISGGDDTGTSASNVFDKNLETFWRSAQVGAAMNDTAYIGYDFGADKKYSVAKFDYYGTNSTSSKINSASLQKSDDGASWTEVEQFSFASSTAVQTKVVATPGAPARYWRLLVRDYARATRWIVYELKLYAQEEAIVVWKPQTSEGVIKNAVVEAIENLNENTIEYYISRDGGTTFTLCSLDTIVDISAQPSDNSVVLKVVLNKTAELLAVAWGGEAFGS